MKVMEEVGTGRSRFGIKADPNGKTGLAAKIRCAGYEWPLR